MKSIEISGTKDGGFLVERKFAGVTSERFIINRKRECPVFRKRGLLGQPLWKREAVAIVQTERRNNPIFFHVEGSIYEDGPPDFVIATEPMGWYYWDETWAYYHGPFESYDAAQQNLVAYFTWLNSPKPELVDCKNTLPPVELTPELDHPLHQTLQITGYTEKE